MKTVEICLSCGGPSDFTGGLLSPRPEEVSISSRKGKGGRWMHTDTFAKVTSHRDVVYWQKDSSGDVFIHVLLNENGTVQHSCRVMLDRQAHSYVRPLQYTLGWVAGALGHREFPTLEAELREMYREHQLPEDGYEKYEEN